MLVGRVLDDQHLGDACEGGGLGGHRITGYRAHEHADLCIGNRARAGDALGGGEVQGLAVVLGNDEDLGAHRIPFFLSASTSSAASFTRTPFWRSGGGSNFTSFSCWRASTSSPASVRLSSGFFLAFMMSGSFT